MEVSPSTEHNSLWECVVQVGSVDFFFFLNMKIGKVTKILKNNNLLNQGSLDHVKVGLTPVLELHNL